MEKYVKLEKVGEGRNLWKSLQSNGENHRKTQKNRLEMDEEPPPPPTALREISLLQMLSKSIYIVRLLCVEHVLQSKDSTVSHSPKSNLYLVFEYLDTYLKKFIVRIEKVRILDHLRLLLCRG
ncbi:unnamed protein product [Arabidopsis halleri]